MKLFNLPVGTLVPSNLAFTETDASQIKAFIESILSFCGGKTNDTWICGMIVLVIELPKWSGSTVRLSWPIVWLDRLRKKKIASRLAFLRFTFHWFLYCSNWKYQKYARCLTSQIAGLFHFKDKNIKRKKCALTWITVTRNGKIVWKHGPST